MFTYHLAEVRRTWMPIRRSGTQGVHIVTCIWHVYGHLADVLELDVRIVVCRFGRLADGPGPGVNSYPGTFGMDLDA